MQWLQLEFDFTTGRYTGDYYDITTIDWFVDSDLGNDANAGTAAAPWKTISKLQSTAGVVNGHRVMINGIFTENVTITKQLRIIGIGGGRNGRAIFNNGGGVNFIKYANNVSVSDSTLENIELTNYNTSLVFMTNSVGIINFNILNCYIISCFISNTTSIGLSLGLQAFYTVFSNCLISGSGSGFPTRGTVVSKDNNTFYNCSITLSGLRITGSNNHINNTISSFSSAFNTGSNNILNTDGQYFSPANNDFNFPSTSPLYQTGTIDGITGEPNNVGAGRLGEFRNADLFEFKVIGGAEYTNTEPDGDDIFRTNDTIDGYFESGIIDLNEIKRNVKIGIHNSYTESGGALTKLIQETDGLTVRQGLDCQLIIGNTANEIITKKLANDWLLYEYGKPVTVTIDGSNVYGNADPLFDPDDFVFAAFRFFKIRFRFKNA
jgi:hypothetical protein